MAEVVFREDEKFLFADITVVPPQLEIFFELKSRAVPPNDSTTGITAGVHRTSDDAGSVTFRFPKDFILEDAPRDLDWSVTHEVAGGTETFTA